MRLAEKDAVLKEYQEDPAHFCDFINGILFQGEPRILPEQIQSYSGELTKTEFRQKKKRPENGSARALQTVWRLRDHTRLIQTDDGEFLVSIQNQSTVDYGMALRVMEEDSLEYRRQVRLRDGRAMKKGTRLPLVLTIVFYHGERNWTGEEDVSSLIQLPGSLGELEVYLPFYRMLLVTPQNIKTENFKRDWRCILELLKRQRDCRQLQDFLEEHLEEYSSLPEDTQKVLCGLINVLDIYERLRKEGGDATVCTAVREMKKESREIGRAEGRKKGIEEGRAEEKLASIRCIMETLRLPLEQALEALKISQSEYREYQRLLKGKD